MSSSRRPGRRVPPKGRGPRPGRSPGESAAAGDDVLAAETPTRLTSRAQNRAAKRAASAGTRPVRRGGTRGRSGGGPSNVGLIALVVGAVAIGAAVIAFGNPFGSPAASPSANPSEAAQGSATPVPSHGDGTCPSSQPPALAAGETRYVTIDTGPGKIVIKVEGALSPIAAGNFVALADCGFYDGVVFHRTAALADGTPFVIQGGDPEGTGGGGPGYTIQDEPVTATYHRGTVAMARSQQANSQGSQFFIVLDEKAEPVLASANTYAIFGEVIAGMDVADAIFGASNGVELPDNPVVMNSVTVSTTPPSPTAPGASLAPSPTAPPVQ
jgi:peptidyl-prolyl cis-trans isomerase B (cyclophilin B)